MRKLKPRRHHADYRVSIVVERDVLIDNAAITCKAALPESVAQHDDTTSLLLVAREHSSY